MSASELYRGYLEELHQLESFLLRRDARERDNAGNDGVALHEDPEVARILEAMAFFAARTRVLARQTTRGALDRLAEEHLGALLEPVPALGLLAADVRGLNKPRMVVPQGELVRVGAGDAEAMFRVARTLVLRPIRVSGVRVGYLRGRGWRIAVGLEASMQLSDIAEPLSLHVRRFDSYEQGARLFQALVQHLRGASWLPGVGVRDQEAMGPASGDAVALTFGEPRLDPDAPGHPLAVVRRAFSLPARELFVNAKLPAAPWRQGTLCFDVGEKWPADLQVDDASFALHVVPIENAFRAPAAPIYADGTRDRFEVAAEDGQARVLRVHGVHALGEERPIMLSPAVFADDDMAFEVEAKGDTARTRRHFVRLQIADAFSNPRDIVVDAWWHDPTLAERLSERLSARLQQKEIVGVAWTILGRMMPHRPSPLWQGGPGLLHLMALRTRRTVSHEVAVGLLEVLGATWTADHAEALTSLRGLEAHLDVDTDRVLYRYRAIVDEVEEEQAPALVDVLRALARLLDAWSEDPVELSVASPQHVLVRRLLDRAPAVSDVPLTEPGLVMGAA